MCTQVSRCLTGIKQQHLAACLKSLRFSNTDEISLSHVTLLSNQDIIPVALHTGREPTVLKQSRLNSPGNLSSFSNFTHLLQNVVSTSWNQTGREEKWWH